MDAKLSPGDHYFDADQIHFHYKVQGQGPLIVVQSVGWGMSAEHLWVTMGPSLQNNTVLYIEPRGNGDSSRPEDPSTMCARVMVEDLEHLRKYLGLDAFPVLLGGSHGGAIALRYAEIYASRVQKLILIGCQVMDSPVKTFVEGSNNHIQSYIEKRKDDPAYQPALGALMKMLTDPPTTDVEFAESMKVLGPWYFSDTSKSYLMSEGITKLPSIWAFQTNKNDTLPENRLPHITEAGKVTAKTLIIWGQEDPMCSLNAAYGLEDGIKGSKLLLVPKTGHCPWLEDPEMFWSELHAFVKE